MNINNTNPSTYFGGTWVLKASSLDVNGYVFGNSKTVGLFTGSTVGGLRQCDLGTNDNGPMGDATSFGKNVGTSCTYQPSTYNGKTIGVVTKTYLDNNSISYNNTGLVADTITVYIWQRTA